MEKINIEKIFGEKFFDGFARLKHWALKGGLAILDQGLFSGSNFVTSILLGYKTTASGSEWSKKVIP